MKKNIKKVGLTIAYVLALFGSNIKTVGDECAHTMASSSEDGPANSCSGENNGPYGNSSCTYLSASGEFPIFCKNTTADTYCHILSINPITGGNNWFTCYVGTVYGLCVNGTCEYSTSFSAYEPDLCPDMTGFVTVECIDG